MLIAQVIVALAGVWIVAMAIISAMRAFVLPRGSRDRIVVAVFTVIRRLFDLCLRPRDSFNRRDNLMAFLAPASLLSLPAVWLAMVLVGYSCIFWALGAAPWRAVAISGSSLLTLGFATDGGHASMVLTFSEATIGLILAALLISFLPTMYAAFARREAAVTSLETRAGSPPAPATMLVRLNRLGALGQLEEIWPDWEDWFVDIGESHTTLAPLIFYRSALLTGSWVTAAGCILDAAALSSSTLDRPRDPLAELCLRAGYLSLQRIADLFRLPFDPDPHYPSTDISVTREEWDAVYDYLDTAGIDVKPDRDKAWNDFAGWRVNYDAALVELAQLTMAPAAAWSSDRDLPLQQRLSLALAQGKKQRVQG